MKPLTLLRPANALAPAAGGDDLRRRLSPLGHGEAETVAAHLAGTGRLPDRILSSPAPRALATAQHMARGLRLPDHRVETDDALYPGDVDDWQQVVFGLDPGAGHVLMVGHNPGISYFAAGLLSRRETVSLQTAGWVCLTFDTDDWADCFRGARCIDRGAP